MTVSKSMAAASSRVISICVTGSGSARGSSAARRLLAHVEGLQAGPPLEDVAGEDDRHAADPVDVLGHGAVADGLDVQGEVPALGRGLVAAAGAVDEAAAIGELQPERGQLLAVERLELERAGRRERVRRRSAVGDVVVVVTSAGSMVDGSGAPSSASSPPHAATTTSEHERRGGRPRRRRPVTRRSRPGVPSGSRISSTMRLITSLLSRMHPWDTSVPIELGSFVPWMPMTPVAAVEAR